VISSTSEGIPVKLSVDICSNVERVFPVGYTGVGIDCRAVPNLKARWPVLYVGLEVCIARILWCPDGSDPARAVNTQSVECEVQEKPAC
jgi:hypothetical protein